MSPPLPQEIFDLIIDFLHDEPDALKVCCIVSKSWVHQTRKHLFAHVEFSSKSHSKLWQTTFPDPSNSPAHNTRSLWIHTSEHFAFADISAGDRIHTFSGVVRLRVSIIANGPEKISLVPLRGLSPTLKSLHLTCKCPATFSEIFCFVCSFPLLEDLVLVSASVKHNETGEWNIPSTSPKLTGYLDVSSLVGSTPSCVDCWSSRMVFTSPRSR